MDNRGLRVLNNVTVITTIILPIIYLLISVFGTLELVGNSWTKLGWVFAYILLTTVAYWVGLVQGIRSIANGRAKTIISASIFQIILYVAYIVDAGFLLYAHRRSSSAWDRGFPKTFIFIFGLLTILAIVKIIIASRHADKDTVTMASKGTAGKIVLICIVAPIVFIVLVVLVTNYMKTHPEVARVVGIVFAIFFMLAVCGVVFLIISLASKNSSGGDAVSSAPSRSSYDAERERRAREAKEAEAASAAEQRIIDDLNERYNRAFKQITGEDPWWLDFKIMKEGPKREAVKALRDRMQQEAREKGVYGKTEWF